ncbi:metal transporter [Inquilinus sp. CAU 1745]|uniref:ZIP family metal transporter n=1 Tax=Inquilinus sp. CAU 1745 TaxID=3140369 RepID=UPI00325B85CA
MIARTALRIAAPVLLILAIVAIFLANDPLQRFTGSVPPVEELTVERTILDSGGISMLVRAGGSEPMRIAQIQVDGAYWSFTQDPPGTLDRMATAWLNIPYPWVTGETHHITMVTSTGVTFDHTIDVAVTTPSISANTLWSYGLVGFFVGVVPVALGMLFYPALRVGGMRAFAFALALTIGLLGFLLVDTLEEALKLAGEAAPGFHGPAMVWLAAALSFIALMTAGRRKGATLGSVGLAVSIALGIGLHNLGEGLAIGSAFATGAASLGSFLVIGFTLHNITEGIGIVAPLVDRKPRFSVFIGLAALAGLPAVAGVWLGSYAFSPHWAALALAVGAGAILQVIVEVGALLARRMQSNGGSWASVTTLSGISVGIALMYATAFLVQI